MRRGLGLAVVLGLAAASASAADLTSASYRVRGLHAAAGGARLTSTAVAPKIGPSGSSLGQGDAIGPAGSAANLTTSWPGFWPLVAGALPSLDADGDLRPTYLDPDDDNDGLLDAVETGTGVFVSASDTGSSPVDADSDDDGIGDGAEVANGTDPNDPLSGPPQVPALPGWTYPGSIWLLASLGAWLTRRRK